MMTLTRLRRCFLLMLLLLAFGCQPNATRTPPAAPSAPPDDAAASDQPAAEDGSSGKVESVGSQVTVEIRSWEDVQQMIAQAKGKVTVVDVWSTWCVPCMREFPHLVKLQQDYPETVTCMSVAANYAGLEDEPPESFRDEVLEFLKKQNAAISNVISSTPDETLYETLGAASVPIVLVYGPDGNLKKMFTNDDQEYGDEGFTYQDHIVPLVDQLLQQ